MVKGDIIQQKRTLLWAVYGFQLIISVARSDLCKNVLAPKISQTDTCKVKKSIKIRSVERAL
jgi:hypothetical protein